MAPPPTPSAAMTVPEEEGRAPTRARTSSGSSGGTTAAEKLTDDILVEIPSRVPAKSLCRFKCVSPHWLGLTNDPHHRKRLPQTMASFFHSLQDRSASEEPQFLGSPVQFTDLSGTHRLPPPVDASFAFIPGHNYQRFDLLDSCNGLLLFRWYDDISPERELNEFRYVVCNPATEKWAALPDSYQAARLSRALYPREQAARLCFDPAVSPHFHVFQIEDEEEDVLGVYLDRKSAVYSSETIVSVYSSETGGWVHRHKTWDGLVRLHKRQSSTVFLNGKLHFHAFDRASTSICLVAVDMAAETWTDFAVPGGMIEGFIQASQGRLHYANLQEEGKDDVSDRLEVYVLENYESKKWALKHSIETFDLAEDIHVAFDGGFDWIAIHPQYNLIYFTVGCDSQFIRYNMDRRKVKVICNLEERKKPYLPYVPLYGELPSLPM